MLKIIIGIWLCFLIETNSMDTNNHPLEKKEEVYPKLTLSSQKGKQIPYNNEEIANYLLESYPYLINKRSMLDGNRDNLFLDVIRSGDTNNFIPVPDYLEEAPIVCSIEAPFHIYMQQVFNSFKPNEFPSLNKNLIKEMKYELGSMNIKSIKNYLILMDNLACLGDNALINSISQSFIKSLIWNRILLVREVFQELFNNKFILNSTQYSLENLQILTAHTQLSKITKDHINNLWVDYEHCPCSNWYYYPYNKIRPWEEQKERKSFQFSELLKKTFNPTINGILHLSIEFDEIFKALSAPYFVAQ